MEQTSKKELFESVPIPKALATLAVPTIISQLINLVYNIVDTFFIGRVGNSYMVAAVTLTFTLFMMTVAFGNLFGIGGGSLIARLSGRQDIKNARKVSAFSFYGAIAISVLYSVLVGAFMEPLLYLMGASEMTIGFAKQYVMLVVVLGTPAIVVAAVLAHLLRNTGYSRQASIGLSGGGILNIILDPLFMFVLLPDGMEVFGAALATLISNVIACIYLLIEVGIVSKSAPLSLSFREMCSIRKEDIKGLFAVGVPSAILTGLFDISSVFLNSLMAAHGDLQLAAIGIVMKAERLPNAINIGICQGMLPIVAYNFASGNSERMNKTIRFARIVGLSVAALSLVMFELLATPIIRVFLSTSAGNVAESLMTISIATGFLRLRCLASPVQFMNYHSSFCMQAMGNGKGTLLHAVMRELVFYIPFMYLLNTFFGEVGLASGLVLGEACGAAFALFLLSRWMKKIRESKRIETA